MVCFVPRFLRQLLRSEKEMTATAENSESFMGVLCVLKSQPTRELGWCAAHASRSQTHGCREHPSVWPCLFGVSLFFQKLRKGITMAGPQLFDETFVVFAEMSPSAAPAKCRPESSRLKLRYAQEALGGLISIRGLASESLTAVLSWDLGLHK